MHEVRSHGLSPVPSGGFETPLSDAGRVESREDANTTLTAWDHYIKKTALAVAKSMGGSGDDADDFEQAARVALWRAISKGAPANKAYRRGIVKNAMLSAVRKERRGFGGLSFAREDFDDESMHCTDDDGLAVRVADWAATLPANLRDIYDWLYVQGYAQREVAQRLGVTRPRITQLHTELKQRARTQLLDPALVFRVLPSSSGRAA
jgi:RNA polymerase sigma factor (sigma-70 family)